MPWNVCLCLDFFYVILKVEGKSPVQLKAKEKTEIEN
jgi:hypothetical protein